MQPEMLIEALTSRTMARRQRENATARSFMGELLGKRLVELVARSQTCGRRTQLLPQLWPALQRWQCSRDLPLSRRPRPREGGLPHPTFAYQVSGDTRR